MIVDLLYILHSSVSWIGSAKQIHYIYTHKSAQDLTVFWVVCLLLSELLALPRALTSGYWAWWLCHIVSTGLMAALLVGAILYRSKK